MAYWVWDASFSVGIEVIDNQHKRIIEYINELNTASRFNDMQKVHTILLHLADYTVSHFSFEESLMEQAKYPMLEPHKQVHQAFINRVGFFKERYENKEDVTKQLMAELQIWLTNHIKHDDNDYIKDVQKMLKEKAEATLVKNNRKAWLTELLGKYFK